MGVNSSDLRPSQVRELILSDHNEIRGHFSKLQSLIVLVEGDLKQAQKLHEAFDAFRNRLLEHLLLEESVLVPALLDADAWGTVRVERLKTEHNGQRQELADLSLPQSKNNIAQFTQRLKTLLTALIKDMEDEEAGNLSANTLRDDIITLNPGED